MNMKRICCIISLFVLCLTFNQAHAQRCLPGMKGLQVTGGMADGVHWNSKSDFACYFGVALSTYTKNRNRWVVGGEYLEKHYPYKDVQIPVSQFTGEGAAGLDLIEVFCDATDIARKYQQGETEVTIPLNTYIAMLKTRGSAELENYGKNINFVSTINTNSNLKFKADFDLGDRITCKETKWGIQIDARITEVTETYQKGEETIEATFGDSLPTLVDKIRKVR